LPQEKTTPLSIERGNAVPGASIIQKRGRYVRPQRLSIWLVSAVLAGSGTAALATRLIDIFVAAKPVTLGLATAWLAAAGLAGAGLATTGLTALLILLPIQILLPVLILTAALVVLIHLAAAFSVVAALIFGTHDISPACLVL
jgi:hypothetical protein